MRAPDPQRVPKEPFGQTHPSLRAIMAVPKPTGLSEAVEAPNRDKPDLIAPEQVEQLMADMDDEHKGVRAQLASSLAARTLPNAPARPHTRTRARARARPPVPFCRRRARRRAVCGEGGIPAVRGADGLGAAGRAGRRDVRRGGHRPHRPPRLCRAAGRGVRAHRAQAHRQARLVLVHLDGRGDALGHAGRLRAAHRPGDAGWRGRRRRNGPRALHLPPAPGQPRGARGAPVARARHRPAGQRARPA